MMSEWIASFGIAAVSILMYIAVLAIAVMTRYGWILFLVLVAAGITVSVHDQLF